jgi:hypothetical protein
VPQAGKSGREHKSIAERYRAYFVGSQEKNINVLDLTIEYGVKLHVNPENVDSFRLGRRERSTSSRAGGAAMKTKTHIESRILNSDFVHFQPLILYPHKRRFLP